MSIPARVLITGASSGIGEALAEAFARRGAAVWVAARRVERLADLVARIQGAGGRATAVTLDVSDARACAARVAALDAAIDGGFDGVVANAGVGGQEKSIWKIDVDDALRVLETNLQGAIATILPLLGPMRARGGGMVVGISSLAADMAQPVAPVYGTSKAGLSFFLESIHSDLKAANISTTIVHPGFVRSEMTDKQDFEMPFMMETADAARAIVDAADRGALYARFPLPLNAFVRTARLLPRGVRAAIIARQAGTRT